MGEREESRNESERIINCKNQTLETVVSEDPFNIFPLINKETKSLTKTPKLKRLAIQKKPKRKIGQGSGSVRIPEGGDEGDKESGSKHGVIRKLKRGRRYKSAIQDGGIDKVVIEGGIILLDNDIKACNKLLIRMEEVDPKKLWKIGNSLGVFEEEISEILERVQELELSQFWRRHRFPMWIASINI